MFLETAVKRLGESISFDALVIGAGQRRDDGSVEITDLLVRHEIPEQFISGYPDVARRDVVAQLFAAYPRIVQVISVKDYRELKSDDLSGGVSGITAGKVVADYLERYGIRHLMLAGIDSSFGLAWVTFYRKSMGAAFNNHDAENAKYLVPYILYEWQLEARKRRYEDKPTSLLPISVHELRIAILYAQGMPLKIIADKMKIDESAAKQHLKNVRARLGIKGWKMTAEDLEHPHRSKASRMARKALLQN